MMNLSKDQCEKDKHLNKNTNTSITNTNKKNIGTTKNKVNSKRKTTP